MRKIILTALFLILFPLESWSATLTVGAGKTYDDTDGTAIQDAINAASANDTIEIYTEQGADNTYVTTIDENDLSGITLKGMVASQGIIIDGTGKGALGSNENVRISAVNNWTLENITFKDDDTTTNGMNVRLSAGTGHKVDQCKFSSTGTDNGNFYELFITTSTSVQVVQNVFNGDKNNNYQLTVQDATATATIKYNEFAGSNVYIALFLGTSGNNAGACTIEYNYFHSTLASGALGVIYDRDTAGHSIKYNLMVINANASGAFSGVHLRDNADNLDIQHNTIVFTAWTANDCPIGAYIDTANINGTSAKNNIVQGGNYGFGAWDTGQEVNASITYNYIYNTDSEYVGGDGSWATDANNTKTNSVAPGFAGAGTVWETDGTDAGTSSDYYRLAVSTPARTTGEGGTYCGAFDYTSPTISGCTMSGTTIQ